MYFNSIVGGLSKHYITNQQHSVTSLNLAVRFISCIPDIKLISIQTMAAVKSRIIYLGSHVNEFLN